MTVTRTFATAGRVLRQISHDPRTVALLMIAPSLLIGLMAWIFDGTTVFNQIGPAMLGLFPLIFMFLITSITTLRERRSGTLERLLTMPISKPDFILGYTLAFGVLAALQAIIASWWSVAVCGLNVKGGVGLLILVAVVNGLLGTALGMLASAFANTEFQAVQFLPVLIFPQVLLGGVLLPRDQMPDVLQSVSDWLPFTYAVDALSTITKSADPWNSIAPDLLVVALFAIGAVALASLTLRRRTT